MKLPTLPARASAALTAAITAALYLSQEVHMSHTLHQAIIIVGGLVLGLLVPGAVPALRSGAAEPAPPYIVGVPKPIPATPDPTEQGLP